MRRCGRDWRVQIDEGDGLREASFGPLPPPWQACATLHDAQFDLDQTRVYAPFTGRIWSRSAIWSRSPTTLLTTLASIDPVWLNFGMSEADYAAFQKGRPKGALAYPDLAGRAGGFMGFLSSLPGSAPYRSVREAVMRHRRHA